MPPLKKEYIGDGVYIEFTGTDFALTVENGVKVFQEIFINIDDAPKLTDYINRALRVKS